MMPTWLKRCRRQRRKRTKSSTPKNAEIVKIAVSERGRPLNRRLADRSETRRPLAIERRVHVDSTTPAQPAGPTRWVGAKLCFPLFCHSFYLSFATTLTCTCICPDIIWIGLALGLFLRTCVQLGVHYGDVMWVRFVAVVVMAREVVFPFGSCRDGRRTLCITFGVKI